MSVRLAALIILALTCVSASHAYYHYFRYSSRATWRALPEKFDLTALPGKTLTYFVRDHSQVQLISGDTHAGLLSQIQLAAQTWDKVAFSDLRLTFGGFTNPNVSSATPHMEVLFEEVPPGVVAQGGIEIRAESNGSFVPILRSFVRLPLDMTRRATHSEAFFTTLVHEVGHALGLQHTLTSGVMSTSTTRSTSKARPLSADDVSGLAILYPAPNVHASHGTISGRVTTQGGAPLNLASVVAISPNGAAISTLTKPDGTYTIEGLPPRSYYVYVHPLPPPIQAQTTYGGIDYPLDPDGRSLAPGVPFETVFYRGSSSGTKDPSAAFTLAVRAGSSSENIDFAVRQISSIAIHSVEAYAYPGNFAVKPPYLSPSILYPFIVATGRGLTQGNGPAPGLRIGVLNGPTLAVKRLDTAPSTFIQADFDVRTLAFSSDSARHLIFSSANDIYVLPSGFFHVHRQPPSITSATLVNSEDGTRLVQISGSNLTAETEILFDGLRVMPRSVDTAAGILTVAPPAAPLGHAASLVALNPDGQSSLFVQADNLPSLTYGAELDAGGTALVSSPVSTLAAGTESLVEINVANADLTTGPVSLGFGTGDVTVRRLWVVSATRVMANVWVSPQAQLGPVQLTLVSGLKASVHTNLFSLVPPTSRSFWLQSTQVNHTTGLGSVYPNSLVTLTVGASPLPLNPTGLSVLLGDRQLPIASVTGNQITFAVPAGTSEGL
ncbi:MAG TPA: carboxypeptidase regulatory-like domain-containing protein, partial [Bryobacteraceae bacterium]|nr:carboxypeptidase regulatory-like domain-containing protein [Bryobacteraceae bacterium]